VKRASVLDESVIWLPTCRGRLNGQFPVREKKKTKSIT
jgi:hypothetical protein